MTEYFPRFPLFIDLVGKRVVVVGGGRVACRRLDVLSQFGASITVIAPQWNRPIEGITWHQRPYEQGDLAGATLAVACTDNGAVNGQVGEEAHGLGIPVSVADDPEASTFFFPALCRGAGVVAGLVSEGGKDHHKTAKMATEIRNLLERYE